MSTLAAEVGTLAAGLRGLRTRLLQIQRYLELVLVGQLPVNHDIMYQLQARPDCLSGSGECVHMLAGYTRQLHGLQLTLASMRMQDVFNLLPNLGVEALSRSFTVQSNDMMLAIYLASLTRSVLALHSLIDNKVPTCITTPLVLSWTQVLGEAVHALMNQSLLVCKTGPVLAQEQRVWKEKEALAASKKAEKPAADSQLVPDSDKSDGAAGASKSDASQK